MLNLQHDVKYIAELRSYSPNNAGLQPLRTSITIKTPYPESYMKTKSYVRTVMTKLLNEALDSRSGYDLADGFEFTFKPEVK